MPICELHKNIELQLTTSIYESGLYKATINQLLIGCSNGTSVTLKMHLVEFKDFIENSDIHIRTFSTSCWLISARYWEELSKFHLFRSMIVLALHWTLLMCPPQFVVITERTNSYSAWSAKYTDFSWTLSIPKTAQFKGGFNPTSQSLMTDIKQNIRALVRPCEH